ncbi:hypothetical protein Lpp22_1033 [Lacticaseibacillus paracasei subsp. paracasei Lpp22]|uniref:Uncharacterized protein n=1 Tax=Lacticaseibacillus paracasei subsp. paracasei Lpp22 TaxID=1256221 RepID=A0A8E0IB12_LACPA|nr:hypothetical protein Lpp22_1033 [Lacticaseibacillus paracasei subsp. paracasei Lpp22]
MHNAKKDHCICAPISERVSSRYSLNASVGLKTPTDAIC